MGEVWMSVGFDAARRSRHVIRPLNVSLVSKPYAPIFIEFQIGFLFAQTASLWRIHRLRCTYICLRLKPSFGMASEN
jgi:hypothetical protein